MKHFLILTALVFLLSASLFFIHILSPLLDAQQTPVPGAQAEEEARIEQAIRQAIDKYKPTIPVFQLFETRIENIRLSEDGNWATAQLSPVDPQTGEVIPTEPGLVIARKEKGDWQVVMPFDTQWETYTQAAPDDLLPPQDKAFWAQLAAPLREAAPQVTYGGYYLPWAAGEVMALTQSVGHDQYTPSGSAHYAFDFAKPGYPSGMWDIHAAKAGVVSRAVWTHPNGDPNYANYLVLEDTTTSPTTYQLYMHLAQESIPSALRVAGTPVARGQFIGIADDTGISSGNHLHFHVHTYPYSYWGVSVDITFVDVSINGGRPRIKSDLPYCKETDVCDQTQTYYTSQNITQPDDTPPTGEIIQPSQGVTVQTSSVHLAGQASDDSSGLASAQFMALYNGSWQTIGSVFTTSPFAFDWDLCANQVPDGPVSLALQLKDNAQNQVFDLDGIVHFTKSYRCPASPPACVPTSNQVALFAKPDFQGACVLLAAGTYHTPTSLGSLKDNNAESVQVGSNLKTTLLSENEFLGRSETFDANDANLSDNLIGANTVSSLIVQTRSTTPAVPVAVWPLQSAVFESNPSLSLFWKDAGGAEMYQARLQGPEQTLTTTWQTQPFWHLSGLTPGSYNWQVRAKYNTALSAWNSSRSFQVQASQSLTMPESPAAQAPYTENFESGAPGWSGNSTWSLTPEANHTPNGVNSIKYKPGSGSGYDTGSPNAGYLTSPPITLPASGEYFLRFWYQYATEGPGIYWDQRLVQLSVNGQPFTSLLQLSDDVANFWLGSPALSLSAYAGQTIQIRFYFATLDEALNTTLGWLIDDFSITANPPPNCQDADNTYLQATPIGYNSATSGVICPGGDIDFFKFQGIQGDHIGIRVDAQSLGSPLDTYLYLLDIDGRSSLAENDDIVLYERSDSFISYWLNRTGTYYIKLRSWDHPTSGGLNYNYTLHLFRDNQVPSASFSFPLEGQPLPRAPINLTVSASDDNSGISLVQFFWHSGDWQDPNWIKLGEDWDGQDGWSLSFDLGILPDPMRIAFYALVFDWAGNWIGTGVWNLNTPRAFFPLLLHLP
jgi:murein DD-endopeptidase MepM/ murein hydrolase activator NlpD